MRKVNKRFNGFTLIELLFAIALIGVLASFGVSMMQKRTENFKVEKTALQIQYILQAGIVWNITHNHIWPVCTPPYHLNDKFYSDYVGQNLIDNPWGSTDYHWCSTDHYALPPQRSKFYVDVQTVSNDVAKRIAALLPSADICNSAKENQPDECSPTNDKGKWVRAYVDVPASIHNDSAPITVQKYADSPYVIASKDNKKDKKSDIKVCKPYSIPVYCGSNEKPMMFVAINSVLFNTSKIHMSKDVKMNVYVDNLSCNNTGKCVFNLCAATYPSLVIQGRFSYLIMCEKEN